MDISNSLQYDFYTGNNGQKARIHLTKISISTERERERERERQRERERERERERMGEIKKESRPLTENKSLTEDKRRGAWTKDAILSSHTHARARTHTLFMRTHFTHTQTSFMYTHTHALTHVRTQTHTLTHTHTLSLSFSLTGSETYRTSKRNLRYCFNPPGNPTTFQRPQCSPWSTVLVPVNISTL